MSDATIRLAARGDKAGAYRVCLETGDHGRNGEPLYRDDPDALGRIYVGPYLAFEPDLSLILEDDQGICGYALAALDSHAFYARYDREWRRQLAAEFPAPHGDAERWTPVQHVYHAYHQPDYFCPDPYEAYPSHLHIDLLPRAQGRGYGRRMIAQVLARLHERGSAGAHLGVSTLNAPARAFYAHIGFRGLARTGSDESGCVYMGMPLGT